MISITHILYDRHKKRKEDLVKRFFVLYKQLISWFGYKGPESRHRHLLNLNHYFHPILPPPDKEKIIVIKNRFSEAPTLFISIF